MALDLSLSGFRDAGAAWLEGLQQRILEARANIRRGSVRAKWEFRWSVRRDFYKQIAGQVSNEIRLETSIQQYIDAQKEDGAYGSAAVAAAIHRGLADHGQKFADAINGWVPAGEVMGLAGGEISQNLPAAMREIVAMGNLRRQLTGELTKGLVEPLIMFVSLVIMLYIMATSVMPSFEQLIPVNKMTGMLYGLYLASNFVTSWFAIALLVALLGLAALIWYSMSRWCGPTRLYVERTLPWSAYREVNGYLWLTGFTGMLATGSIADKDVLALQIRYASPWLRERLAAFAHDLAHGRSLPQAMSAPRVAGRSFEFPSKPLVRLTGWMYGLKDFEARMTEELRDYRQELADRLQGRMRVIGLVMGFLSLFLMIGVCLAAFGMSNALANQSNHQVSMNWSAPVEQVAQLRTGSQSGRRTRNSVRLVYGAASAVVSAALS